MYKTKNEKETIKLGRKIAKKHLSNNNKVVFLIGDLGAGKTTITKGIAKGLGIKNTITSPTFTIMNEYHIKDNSLYHLDMYRIESHEELFEIGLDSYILGEFKNNKSNTVLVEWPERVESIRKKPDITIKINKIDNNKREILIDEY